MGMRNYRHVGANKNYISGMTTGITAGETGNSSSGSGGVISKDTIKSLLIIGNAENDNIIKLNVGIPTISLLIEKI